MQEELTYSEVEEIAEKLLKAFVCPMFCEMSPEILKIHPKILDFVKFLESKNRWPND